jgi:hypothetical protein
MDKNPFKEALLNSLLNLPNKPQQERVNGLSRQNKNLTEIGSSILKRFLDIEEEVIKNGVIKDFFNLSSSTDVDSLITLDEGHILFFNSANERFNSTVSKDFRKYFDLLDPLSILQDIFVKAFYFEDRFIDFSENKLLNVLLNIRLKFIEDNLEFLIKIHRRSNPDGIVRKDGIIKSIISKLRTSIQKDKRLHCFPTMNLGEKKLHACKSTADNYAKELIKMYRNKLKYLTKQEIDTKGPTISETEGYFKLADAKKFASLRNLWFSLMKDEFIKNDNESFKDFKNIFSPGIPKTKIEWTGTIGELNYFIRLLCTKEPKRTIVARNQHWTLTLKYFNGITKAGIQFKHDNLKGAKPPLLQQRFLLEKAVRNYL